MSGPAQIGAICRADGVTFRVWALGHERVEVVLFDGAAEADSYDMAPEPDGYFSRHLPGITAGARYQFRLDSAGSFPDPASRWQPEGVHGPSMVVDPAFAWSDQAWRGLPIEEMVIYELHIGTFTPEGTFEAIIPKLDYLRDLGVTAIELMPVGDFPGDRNWGYDGVSLWAPSRAYGQPRDFKRLVDAAHQRGIAVLLDVVYNHLGPDGNYLGVYSSAYFTDRHHTPWGAALNFDGPDSRPVRDFMIGNARYWVEEFHLDGLRLDATHQIQDDSDRHLLRELGDAVRAALPDGRRVVLIAEDERNEARLVTPAARGGIGLDGIWADDLHHQLRRAVTGVNEGYFALYSGETADIARTLQRGWYFEGQPAPNGEDVPGTLSDGLPYPAFVHCIMNHDQVGNRAFGERLDHLVELPVYRALATLLLVDPATPLLFMGQEWAATSPFLFFTDHEENLGRLVTQGRRSEFAAFTAFADEALRDRIPDPQAESSFELSKLNWEERAAPAHAGIERLYREALALRRSHPALLERSRDSVQSESLGDRALLMRRSGGDSDLLLLVNLAGPLTVELSTLPLASSEGWSLLFSSEAARYGGDGGIALDGTTLSFAGAGAALLEVKQGSSVGA